MATPRDIRAFPKESLTMSRTENGTALVAPSLSPSASKLADDLPARLASGAVAATPPGSTAAKLNPDPLLSPKEAADYIGVTVQTLSVWRSTQRYPLPFVKSGAKVFYRRSALEKFLESRTKGSEEVQA